MTESIDLDKWCEIHQFKINTQQIQTLDKDKYYYYITKKGKFHIYYTYVQITVNKNKNILDINGDNITKLDDVPSKLADIPKFNNSNNSYEQDDVVEKDGKYYIYDEGEDEDEQPQTVITVNSSTGTFIKVDKGENEGENEGEDNGDKGEDKGEDDGDEGNIIDFINDIKKNIKDFDNIKKIQFHNLLIHIFYSFCNIKYLCNKNSNLKIYINTFQNQQEEKEEEEGEEGEEGEEEEEEGEEGEEEEEGEEGEEDSEIYLKLQKNIVDNYNEKILFLLNDYIGCFIDKLNINKIRYGDNTVILDDHYIIINGTNYSDWSNINTNMFNIIMYPDGCKDITGKKKNDFDFDKDVKKYEDFFLDTKDVNKIYLYDIIDISVNKGKDKYIQTLFTHIYNRFKEIKYLLKTYPGVKKYILSNDIKNYKDAINNYYGNITYDIIYIYLIRCLKIFLKGHYQYNFEDNLDDNSEDNIQNIFFKNDDTWNDKHDFTIFVGNVDDDNKNSVLDSSNNALLNPINQKIKKYDKDDDIDDYLLEPLLNITIVDPPKVDPPNVDPLKVDLPDNIKLSNKQFIIHCYQMLLHHMLKYDKYSMNNMDEKTYLYIMDKMTNLLKEDVKLSGGHFYELYIKNKKNYENISNINKTYFYDLYVKNKSMYISLT